MTPARPLKTLGRLDVTTSEFGDVISESLGTCRANAVQLTNLQNWVKEEGK